MGRSDAFLKTWFDSLPFLLSPIYMINIPYNQIPLAKIYLESRKEIYLLFIKI